MDVIIVGGGIGGLTLALALHATGTARRIRVFEAAPEIRPLGIGINIGAHAMKELSALGPEDALVATSASRRTTRSSRGTASSSIASRSARRPGTSGRISRFSAPDLHGCCSTRCASGSAPRTSSPATAAPASSKAGPGHGAFRRRRTARRCGPQRAISLIACDGIHSAVRTQFYPDEGPFKFRGYNLWRGVTLHKPFLTGASIARIGARHSTMIIYPLRNNFDGQATRCSTGSARSSATWRFRSTGTSRAGWRISCRPIRTGCSTGWTCRR